MTKSTFYYKIIVKDFFMAQTGNLKGNIDFMKKLISIFGYLAYVILGVSMITTAKAEIKYPEENAGLFANKFGFDIEPAVLAVICTFLVIYVIIAAIAFTIKLGHAGLNFAFCGALSMLFDVIFCIIHGVILYFIIQADSSTTAIIYLAVLFAISMFTLFSNGASLTKPVASKK